MTIRDKYEHINLMPYQWEPFNGDTILEEHFLRLRDKWNIHAVVEGGTCLGSTALWLAANFTIVSTIEINSEFLNIAKERFEESGCHNVVALLGSTTDCLDVIISTIPPPPSPTFLYWADSHWLHHNPLIRELEIIAESGHKPVIAIHDFKVPGHPELGFDVYPAQNIVYEWDWIKDSIEKIYGPDGYEVSYNSEALGAKRGCVFIEPKL